MRQIDYTKLSNSIPCPSCDNTLKQGSVHIGKITFISYFCDCGYMMMLVSGDDKKFEVSATLMKDN